LLLADPLGRQVSDLLFERLARTFERDETYAKPAGISARQVIEIAIRFLFAFDPRVRNQQS